jgi:hypothetical protein
LRSAIVADMSISLKVVSSAACACDCRSRSATRLRNGDIGTISSASAGREGIVTPVFGARGISS